MKRISVQLIALLILITMVLTACTSSTKPTTGTTTPEPQKSAGPAKMTEQGTPRAQTLIVDVLGGRVTNPQQMNYLIPGTEYTNGLHQICMANLYEIDGTKGNMVPILAAKAPEAENADFTKWKVTLRDNLKWDNGMDFTADDVAYTANLLATNKDLPGYGFWSGAIKKATALDKTTVEFEMVKSWPRFDTLVGDQIWDDGFHVVPKAIWEKMDVAKDPYSKPVCIGPYKLKSVDSNGYWTLWEKRADWQNAAWGNLGEPKPQFIEFKFYGPEEKRILAGINHDLDVFMDISADSWDVLRKKDPNAHAWFDSFPYANMDDPCERGMDINSGKAPFDKVEVRWALTLATDIQSVSMATFGGKLRFAPLNVPPLSGLQPVYHYAMEDWLKNFSLSDGYKPFDGDQASKLVASLAGEQGLPTDLKAQKDTFGVGWWKYDPAEAGKLLESVGFKKGADGKWLKPDGTPWKISINTPANFEVESGKLAYAVADSWKKFGIDATAVAMEAGPFWQARDNGDFEVGSYWPGCGIQPDIFNQVQGWHQNLAAPLGKIGAGDPERFKSDKIASSIDQLRSLAPTDPKIVPVTTDLLKTFVTDMPWIPMFGTSKFVPTENYYWNGFPNAKDPYFGPWWWWSNFPFILNHLQPTGNQ